MATPRRQQQRRPQTTTQAPPSTRPTWARTDLRVFAREYEESYRRDADAEAREAQEHTEWEGHLRAQASDGVRRAAKQKGRRQGAVNRLTRLIHAYRKKHPDAPPEDALEYFKRGEGEVFEVIDEIKPERHPRRTGKTKIDDRVYWRRDARTGKQSEKRTWWSSIATNWNTRYRPTSCCSGCTNGCGSLLSGSNWSYAELVRTALVAWLDGHESTASRKETTR